MRSKRVKQKPPKKRLFLRIMTNIIGFILVQALVFCTFSVGMVFYGPFQNIKEMVVTTAMTTLSHQYLATAFLSKAEIDSIMAKNKIDDADKKTDEQAIQVAAAPLDSSTEDKDKHKDDVQLIDISENKMKGYVLLIKDPKRVTIGTSDQIGKYGMKLLDMIKKEGAIAGINAGGFSDENGKGNGGTPQGLLIKDGQIIFGQENKVYSVIGLNSEGVLVLGKFNLQQVREKKIVQAATFEPFLIVNGEPLIKEGNNGGWGLAPRTAIGQTKDGTIILLVIDGRQLSSIGASLKDVQDIMLKYGAYNAANLDGGASTTMVHNGEIVNHPCSQYGPRYLPSAFIVK